MSTLLGLTISVYICGVSEMRKGVHRMNKLMFFVFNLCILSFTLFVSFFIAVRLTKPAIEVLEKMNSGDATLVEWMQFAPLAAIGTVFMTALILIVDYTKANLIELLRHNNIN